MKRIINACLEQTLLFSLKEKTDPKQDRILIVEEFEQYKTQMERKRMAYQILSLDEMADGSLLVKIRRQYNSYPCDEYIK